MKECEFGERFSDRDDEEVKYIQILAPSKVMEMLRGVGFEISYHNTRRRIERQRAWRWWSVFEDGERMYVAQKPL